MKRVRNGISLDGVLGSASGELPIQIFQESSVVEEICCAGPDSGKSYEQHHARLSFDWFTLAVAMLFTVEAVELKGNRLQIRETTL